MIDRIYFKNFKAFAELDLPLKPLTVLVGPNGSGKSSVLEGLWLLAGRALDDGGKGDEGLNRRSRRGAQGPTILARFSGDLGFRIVSGGSVHREFFPTRDQPVDDPTSFASGSGRAANESPPPTATLLRLSAAQIAKPSYVEQNPPPLESDGTNLPSVLAYLALNRPDEFDRLQACCRRVLPAVKRIRFDRAMVTRSEKETVAIDEAKLTRLVSRQFPADALLFDMASGIAVPAEFASDGMLLVLGLLAAFFLPAKPELILLDDFDHGLHPLAQADLVDLIRDLQGERPELQVVTSTHSPYLLDRLDADREQIVCTRLLDDGTAVAAPLNRHPDFNRWKQEMSPGELWSVFGELWVDSTAAAARE